jgi:hypothetical protein
MVASAFFKALAMLQTCKCDSTFARLLTPRMAKAPDNDQVAGYGVKLFPAWKVLDQFRVPEEQRTILRQLGDPKQSWQKMVDPRTRLIRRLWLGLGAKRAAWTQRAATTSSPSDPAIHHRLKTSTAGGREASFEGLTIPTAIGRGNHYGTPDCLTFFKDWTKSGRCSDDGHT